MHQGGTGHVAAAGGCVAVHDNALQLKVGVAMVRAGGVDAMLVGDNLPELGTWELLKPADSETKKRISGPDKLGPGNIAHTVST